MTEGTSSAGAEPCRNRSLPRVLSGRVQLAPRRSVEQRIELSGMAVNFNRVTIRVCASGSEVAVFTMYPSDRFVFEQWTQQLRRCHCSWMPYHHAAAARDRSTLTGSAGV